MILCANLNAAIDRTLVVEGFRLNKIHRPDEVLALPGGKGVNVARVLKSLGEEPLVIGWVGGITGRFIEEGLKREGIRAACVQAPGESRTCLSILDSSNGKLTEIYEQGESIPRNVQESLVDIYTGLLSSCRLVTLSGSLPPGVPADFYVKLINLAKRVGVPSLLDTNGEPLRLGFEFGKPYLVKPNRDELFALIKRKPRTLQGFHRAADELSIRSGGTVTISLGRDGLVAAGPQGSFHASPPEVNILSTVGSGDALLAGLAYGYVNNFTFEETLRAAIAAGTANAMRLGAGKFDYEDFSSITSSVRVARLT